MIQNHNQGNLKTYEYIHELKLAWIRRISNNSELIAFFLSVVFVFVLFCFCFVLFYFYAKYAIYTVCCMLKVQNFENNLRNKIILVAILISFGKMILWHGPKQNTTCQTIFPIVLTNTLWYITITSIKVGRIFFLFFLTSNGYVMMFTRLVIFPVHYSWFHFFFHSIHNEARVRKKLVPRNKIKNERQHADMLQTI